MYPIPPRIWMASSVTYQAASYIQIQQPPADFKVKLQMFKLKKEYKTQNIQQHHKWSDYISNKSTMSNRFVGKF
jgi:Na+-transporting NADH:ubiquinone oxidoreductase subunit NqrF